MKLLYVTWLLTLYLCHDHFEHVYVYKFKFALIDLFYLASTPSCKDKTDIFSFYKVWGTQSSIHLDLCFRRMQVQFHSAFSSVLVSTNTWGKYVALYWLKFSILFTSSSLTLSACGLELSRLVYSWFIKTFFVDNYKLLHGVSQHTQ